MPEPLDYESPPKETSSTSVWWYIAFALEVVGFAWGIYWYWNRYLRARA